MSGFWLAILLGIVGARLLLRPVNGEPAIDRGDYLLFTMGKYYRWLFVVAVVVCLLLLLVGVFSEENHFLVWVSLLTGLILVISKPGNIEMTGGRVTMSWLFGLYRKSIDWSTVEYAINDPFDNTVSIVGADGVTIRHDSQLVGRAQFLSEVAKHTKVLSTEHKPL